MSNDQSITPTTTEYRIVAGEPGYRVGDDGSAWTCLIRAPKGKGTGSGSKTQPDPIWRRLKPGTSSGHPIVSLRGKMRYVHHLVLEAFVGPCPERLECCHNDGNPANNRVGNLRWDTRKSNIADQIEHGVMARGETNGRSKMTDSIVRDIRAEYASGRVSLRALGSKHGVDCKTIHAIVVRRTWQHVD